MTCFIFATKYFHILIISDSELEQELKLQHKEVVRLQDLIKEIKDMEVNKRKKLCKSSRCNVNIAPVTRVCAAIQATAEMKDVEVSTQRLSDINLSNISILEVRRSHRRTASDGDIHLGSRLRRSNNFIAERDKQQLSSHSHCFATKISSKVHSHTTDREGVCHTIYRHKKENSSHHCLWQEKVKSLQQRLKSVSEQVRAMSG